MKNCGIYYKNHYLYIVATVSVDGNFDVSSSPMIKLYAGEDLEEIGRAVVFALESHKILSKPPEGFKLATKEFFNFLNAKSQRDLDRSAAYFCVLETSGNLTIIPHEVHDDGGFVPLSDEQVEIPHDLRVLGKTIVGMVNNRSELPA